MGSSAKRKKEKKQDFQKPKLKVGKAKPKASNFTDTSFKAKAVVLNQQSLSAGAPSTVAQFSHHLSMLTHKSDTQRKESLAYLTTAITSTSATAPLPQPVAVILPKVQPLVLDGSKGVREQLLKLLQALPAPDVSSHADQLLLYTRAGMTHLAAEIRSSALDVLDWLLEVAGTDVVGSAGGWVKTLKCFLGLLNWQTDASGKWTASKASFGKTGTEGKILVKQLNVLASFLRAGLAPPGQKGIGFDAAAAAFPLYQVEQHMLSRRSNAFGHLNLFGAPRDEETEMYEDRGDRQRVFHDRAQAAIIAGLEQAKKEGGEVGRAAAQLRKAMIEGMVDFGEEDMD